MIERIVLALDGSEVSEKALPYAQALAEKFAAPVTIVRSYEGEEQASRMLATMASEPSGVVDPRTVEIITQAAEEGAKAAQSYAASIAERLRVGGVTAVTSVTDQSPATAILEAAGGDQSALIVMCTHGRGSLSRAILGSVANSVVQKAHGPVFLVRVYESSSNVGRENAMDIRIGAEVMGTTGKLGEVSRVIVDARGEQVTEIVVKHGFLSGTERVVPISDIKTVEDGIIFLGVDDKEFERYNGFASDRYRAPDPSYVGPPGFRNEEYLLDTMVAVGPAGGLAGAVPTMGYPSGEQVTPSDMARPAVGSGTPVLDVNGVKVGEVHELSVSSDHGIPTRLVVRSGFIFKHDTELDVSHIKEVADDGIMLSVTKDQLEAMNP